MSTTTTQTTTTTLTTPRVLSVSKSTTHSSPSKNPVPFITLITDLGVAGDCHAGKTIQHSPQQQTNPTSTNLRQVHLVPVETLREVSQKLSPALALTAGQIGENVTTEGIELAGLPRGTELRFGNGGAVIVLTGVREPGPGLDRVRAGLRGEFLGMGRRWAGVMGVVMRGGEVRPGMGITLVKPGGMETLPVV
ncbi:PK beta-barrel-protein domain-containing protein-like protein [Aspergillus sclerotioniger CBS 115572]|uniref:PK beta-barrel-protein domain-containing protein-like protein n=1 Tax=Aspergillus sclerotioniger CBS 115572 TaxID=1450535 RepID=A0A317XAI0_9EURO|nr:PK beta-barrel-protein domain-containing protein-like protein [Aspergillus sclerotioniger CBS 115572]PWY94577.1 PK beta-barrel-protein domain-containing protein-like protein [Aspergillus sclerotioniger CBS 115572]